MKKFAYIITAIALITVLAWGSAIEPNAREDFSGTQGKNGWRYRLWYPKTGVSHDLPLWDESTKTWRENDGAIWAGGMHPHSTDWYIVREWTSTITGRVSISGTALTYEKAAGVILKVFKGYDVQNEQWSARLKANQSAEMKKTFRVKRGDQILFAVIGDGGIANDSIDWNIRITPEPENQDE